MSQDKQLAAAVLTTLLSDIEQLEMALMKGFPPKITRQQRKTRDMWESRARDAVSCLFAQVNDHLAHWLQILDISAVALQEKVKVLFPLSMVRLMA